MFREVRDLVKVPQVLGDKAKCETSISSDSGSFMMYLCACERERQKDSETSPVNSLL